MRSKQARALLLTLLASLAVLSGGCGQYVRQGNSPVQVVVVSLQAAPGADPQQLGATLNSDVITNVRRTVGGQQVEIPTVFNDFGSITMRLMLKDQGAPGFASAPSDVNAVTFTRYRVTYRRADGRNTPGVDVPFSFDSAATFTVSATGTATVGFELVRHNAKEEAPLAALRGNAATITTLTEVSFFGRDQAGHDVTATGTIGIIFGNFGDPQ